MSRGRGKTNLCPKTALFGPKNNKVVGLSVRGKTYVELVVLVFKVRGKTVDVGRVDFMGALISLIATARKAPNIQDRDQKDSSFATQRPEILCRLS
jgi:hypothetical protein